ncbi:Hypothetical protein SMAX5B_001820 [Scophthalmus maximus]|uniref:Uncharacterized protein n=1 Tax=Scophthalmus maximus TaxID=52904 RepID=A0A2U9CW46_SCOMX|nr:Hypothetical protein SMAX5B_001820 [Scophthalmus maximus]
MNSEQCGGKSERVQPLSTKVDYTSVHNPQVLHDAAAKISTKTRRFPCGSAALLVFLCSEGGLLFHFAAEVSTSPQPDHCQWESPSNPFLCLAWYRLVLPLHICMSCDVSAKVCSDVMGTDGSIFPADSDDCHAQV